MIPIDRIASGRPWTTVWRQRDAAVALGVAVPARRDGDRHCPAVTQRVGLPSGLDWGTYRPLPIAAAGTSVLVK